MRVLSQEKQIDILKLLSEGMTISAASRCHRVHRDTCARLMLRFGRACEKFLNNEMHDLQLGHVQVDELWTFCKKKGERWTGNEPDADEIGEFYLFVALDEETRLIPVYRIGRRTEETTLHFMLDFFNRLKKPIPHFSDPHAYKGGGHKPIIRISTDAFPAYPGAIDMAFGPFASHAILRKVIKPDEVKIVKTVISGDIDPKKVTTSLVERSNLTTRTHMRRLTRKALGFSKKMTNLKAATAIHITTYNYCRKHGSLDTAPAVQAGLTDKRWTFEELYIHLKKRFPENFLRTTAV